MLQANKSERPFSWWDLEIVWFLKEINKNAPEVLLNIWKKDDHFIISFLVVRLRERRPDCKNALDV